MKADNKTKQDIILLVFMAGCVVLALIAFNSNNYIYRGIIGAITAVASILLYKPIANFELSKKVIICIVYWIAIYAIFYIVKHVI